MRQRPTSENQGLLFDAGESAAPRRKTTVPDTDSKSTWRMPEVSGRTAAEIRVEWRKRLSPGQVTRVEAELNSFVARLNKLGFGAVHVARSFVRRRKD
jgi:hypothetical protein